MAFVLVKQRDSCALDVFGHAVCGSAVAARAGDDVSYRCEGGVVLVAGIEELANPLCSRAVERSTTSSPDSLNSRAVTRALADILFAHDLRAFTTDSDGSIASGFSVIASRTIRSMVCLLFAYPAWHSPAA
ncbi:MAG: hypothetical protein H0W87_02845 [Actinobacteria bacterium]|nr:hypothetical protein [Actinomycetota bacterium]